MNKETLDKINNLHSQIEKSKETKKGLIHLQVTTGTWKGGSDLFRTKVSDKLKNLVYDLLLKECNAEILYLENEIDKLIK